MGVPGGFFFIECCPTALPRNARGIMIAISAFSATCIVINGMGFDVDYPQEMEEWWNQYALKYFGVASLHDCEHQLERNVQALSDQFTRERPKPLTDYFADPELLAAYGLFFFPQSYARTSMILQEILARGWKPDREVSVLDLGSGTGAAAFGVLSVLKNSSVAVHAVDRSAAALRVLQLIASDCRMLWPSAVISVERADMWEWMKKQERKYDLVIASFSVNESNLSMADPIQLLSRLLSDRGIAIIIEPALQATSEALERWRDEIAAKGDLHIWGPCLHSKSCPLLMEGKFWCHEVRSWEPPASLRFLNRHLYRQIHVLKYSFLAFGRKEPDTMSHSAFRLISPVSRRKRSLVFTGCSIDGTKKDFRISGPLTEHERRFIHRWERGDILDRFPETAKGK